MKAVRLQYGKLSVRQKLHLRGQLELLHAELEGVFTVATTCSGTDVWVAALAAVFRLWSELYGIR
jgi:hypothetical protein